MRRAHPARCGRSHRGEAGRTIAVGRHEAPSGRSLRPGPGARLAQRLPVYRPKVERNLGHLMRRRHDGRRGRVRGQAKVDAAFNLLAAAHNLARLATLGLRGSLDGKWAVA
jgi:hypothetical protein